MDLKPAKLLSYADLPPGTIIVCPKCGTKNMRTEFSCRNCDFDLRAVKAEVAEGVAVDPVKFRAVCLKCGAENPVDAKFCGSCGWSVGDAPVPGPAVKSTLPSGVFDTLTKAIFYIFSLIVPVVGVIIGAILINAAKDADSDFREVGRVCLALSLVNLVVLILLMIMGVISVASA